MAHLITTTDGEVFKQIGEVAMRTPTGEFLESHPIYIKVSADELNPKTQMLPQEEKALSDISSLFAEKFSEYVKGCRKQGIDLGI